MAELTPVVIIAGPTASGKSAFAMEVASQFDGEIINADSMQVYQELSVLTARPTEQDERQVPHHLYGTVPASEPWSAGKWLDLANAAICDIHQRNKVPIVCGGTGLYLKVLTEGMADIPDVPSEVVDEAEALYRTLGSEIFLARLADVDPHSASKLAPSDRQRLVRAYSVVTATGKSLADWHAEQPARALLDGRFFSLYLMPDRADLYQKIERRFDEMLALGGLEEVQNLAQLNLPQSLPAMKALGVPELLEVLAGHISMGQAIDHAKQTTRNLAKRQFTWFRNQGAPNLVIEQFGPDALEEGLNAVSVFLTNPS